MIDQIHDAFAALQAGDPGPMTMAVAQYGPEEVGVVLAEAGEYLGDYWPLPEPEAEEPQPGGVMTRGGATTGGVMYREGYTGSGSKFLDDMFRSLGAADASRWPTKSHYVSDPSSPGYDPTSGFYSSSLDSSVTVSVSELPPKKKKANAGLWGLALVIGALAFGAM